MQEKTIKTRHFKKGILNTENQKAPRTSLKLY